MNFSVKNLVRLTAALILADQVTMRFVLPMSGRRAGDLVPQIGLGVEDFSQAALALALYPMLRKIPGLG